MKKQTIKGQFNENSMFEVEGGDLELNGGTIMYCMRKNIPYGSQPVAVTRCDESPETLYFTAFKSGFNAGRPINLSKVVDLFGLKYLISSLYSKDRKETLQTYKGGFNDGAAARKEAEEKPNRTIEILVLEECDGK